MALPLPSNVEPPVACTVIVLVPSSPFAPLTQKVCPAIGVDEVHCGKISILANDDELFHTIVPSAVVAESVVPLEMTRLTPEAAIALITPFDIPIVVPSGWTTPKEPVDANPGVTARDQWSLPSELAQT